MSNTCSQYFWKDHDIPMSLEFYPPAWEIASLMMTIPQWLVALVSHSLRGKLHPQSINDLPVRRSCSSNLSCGWKTPTAPWLPLSWGTWIPVRIVPWHPFNHIMVDPPSHHTAPLAMRTHGFGDGGNGRPLLQIVTIVIGLIIRYDLICILGGVSPLHQWYLPWNKSRIRWFSDWTAQLFPSNRSPTVASISIFR